MKFVMAKLDDVKGGEALEPEEGRLGRHVKSWNVANECHNSTIFLEQFPLSHD